MFKNKKILITGSKGQLGSTLVKYFTKFGAKVISADIKGNDKANFYKVDLRNEEEIKLFFSKIKKKYKYLDILINNAGKTIVTSFNKRNKKEINDILDTNIVSTILCSKEFVKICNNKKKLDCNIINISSIYGLLSPDFRIYGNSKRNSPEIYGASKAGIIQLTKYYATHFSTKNIRVNCVSPGGILNRKIQNDKFIKNYSQRVPMTRMANTSEIVNAVSFLASDKASYINGHNLIVDGGLSCW